MGHLQSQVYPGLRVVDDLDILQHMVVQQGIGLLRALPGCLQDQDAHVSLCLSLGLDPCQDHHSKIDSLAAWLHR